MMPDVGVDVAVKITKALSTDKFSINIFKIAVFSTYNSHETKSQITVGIYLQSR